MKGLKTRRGVLSWPAFVPVTTHGEKHRLDELVRPYLPRLASAVMVSRHYAKVDALAASRLPVMLDSGGFVALRGTVDEHRGLGLVTGPDGTRVHPRDVLELQERAADVAFTLDLPALPMAPAAEHHRRRRLTLANALWALEHRRRTDLPLYAVVHGEAEQAAQLTAELDRSPFAGIAIGGLVPHARDHAHVLSVVAAVRAKTDLPIHVFGLGQPAMVAALFERGVQSVDSSAWVRAALDGRSWADGSRIAKPSPTERLHLALLNLAVVTGAALPLAVAERLRTAHLAGDR
jgi:helicase